MARIRAFRGLRPQPALAARAACPPYDVINSEEARRLAEGNPDSFLYVVKPEIALPPELDTHDALVYETGRAQLERLLASGSYLQDASPCLYLYQLEMEGRVQTGVAAATSVADYLSGVIKKHELTRPDKEEDRRQHIRVTGVHAEPVLFAYPDVEDLDSFIRSLTAAAPPVYSFTAADGISHRMWVVEDAAAIARITEGFAASVPAVYIADGHHRSAAAASAGEARRLANPAHTGGEDYNWFLAVHFPASELRIMDYNRVVRDLNGLSASGFLSQLEASFTVEPQPAAYRPEALHCMGLYLPGQWYRLEARPGTFDSSDPVGVLDVTILSRQVLEPLLGIRDLRRDQRIDFVGGMRGLGELERRVDSGEMAAAFALYPVSMQQLIGLSDAGEIMPPKTTWFEPKLRSGLIVHPF